MMMNWSRAITIAIGRKTGVSKSFPKGLSGNVVNETLRRKLVLYGGISLKANNLLLALAQVALALAHVAMTKSKMMAMKVMTMKIMTMKMMTMKMITKVISEKRMYYLNLDVLRHFSSIQRNFSAHSASYKTQRRCRGYQYSTVAGNATVSKSNYGAFQIAHLARKPS